MTLNGQINLNCSQNVHYVGFHHHKLKRNPSLNVLTRGKCYCFVCFYSLVCLFAFCLFRFVFVLFCFVFCFKEITLVEFSPLYTDRARSNQNEVHSTNKFKQHIKFHPNRLRTLQDKITDVEVRAFFHPCKFESMSNSLCLTSKCRAQ